MTTTTSEGIFQPCTDTSDAKILSAAYQLFLKPVARINISIAIPNAKRSGKTVNNSEVIEKIKYWAQPEQFMYVNITKSTLEFIRLDAEIENRSKLLSVLARLDGRSIKISGFSDGLKVRAVEAKPDFPTRHDWDSYFRDAKNMNEMKPGERPDTIYLSNLPIKWFAHRGMKNPSSPSEMVLKRIFQNFGDIREIDVPMNDTYRTQMKPYISGITLPIHHNTPIFEAYIQFKEYVCFVKAMDALRGMKLLHIDGEKAFCANIKVDFDKTKHLSDSSIRKRSIEKEKLIAKEKEKEEKKLQDMKENERKQLLELEEKEKQKQIKLERQKLREEKRKEKKLQKLAKKECNSMNKKIISEEYLYLIAQRKLQTIRLLSFLFDKVKENKELESKREKKLAKMKLKGIEPTKKEKLEDVKRLKEISFRNKLIKRFKKKGDLKLDDSCALTDSDDSDSSTSSLDTKTEPSDATVTNTPTEYPPGHWRGSRPPYGRGHNFYNNRGFRGRYNRGGFVPHNPMMMFHPPGGFPPHPLDPLADTGDTSSTPGTGETNADGTTTAATTEDGENSTATGSGTNNINRGGFYQRRPRGQRGGPMWMPRFPPRGGLPPPFFPPFPHPFFPFDLQEYYKYFSRFKDGDRDSRSRSRSRSRKRSRRSRSYSRSSRSRSYSSRSRSRSSRSYSSRSRSYSRSRSRSRTRSRSKTRARSRSRTHSRSRSRTRSSRSRSRSKSRSRYDKHRSSRKDATKSRSKSNEKNGIDSKIDGENDDKAKSSSSSKKKSKKDKKSKKSKKKSKDKDKEKENSDKDVENEKTEDKVEEKKEEEGEEVVKNNVEEKMAVDEEEIDEQATYEAIMNA